MKRPKTTYLLAFVAIASIVVSPLLAFAFPVTSSRLIDVYLLCLIGLFVSFLGALLRRRWRDVGILLAICPFVLFQIYGFPVIWWMHVQAFRLHAWSIDDYLSRCKLIEFVEGGSNHRLGRCERLRTTVRDLVREVYYDSTGELELPVAQRTGEWKTAIGHFTPRALLIKQEGRADKLFGHFYEIYFSLLESDGSDDDPF